MPERESSYHKSTCTNDKARLDIKLAYSNKKSEITKAHFEIDKRSFAPVVFSCMEEAGPSSPRTEKELARNLQKERKTTPTRTQ